MQILFSTKNIHKLQEFSNKLNLINFKFEIKSLYDFDFEIEDIEETELTLEGNARIKSQKIFEKFFIPTISDDTGLEVFELKNTPGVFSARYSGVYGDDQANRNKLLHELLESNDRRAQFRTVICFVDENSTIFFEGICKGKISKSEKGENGFGYDSIFIPDGYDKTFAELDLAEKNRISHRAKAIDLLIEFFKNYS